MPYRITGTGVSEVPETTALDESLYEKDVEDWVAEKPDILGEPLLIIGRQVQLDEGRDRIDLLALDKAANLVVIELKRDLVGVDADLQAVRYAAQVSQWTHEDVRRAAEGYWKSSKEPRGTFAQEVEKFADEGSQVNADQRVILAGRDMKPRLGTMALWLRKHALDISVVAIGVLKDGDRLYLKPQVVIPVPSEDKLRSAVSIGSSDKPWLVDGQQWHLEQRCSAKGRKIVEALVDLIAEAVPEADGPNWNQKQYVSWKVGTRNWIGMGTQANQVTLDIGGFSVGPAVIAEQLGFAVFREDADLATKFALGSSVGTTSRDRDDWLFIIVKSVKDIENSRAAFSSVLQNAWAQFSGQ
jgi:hypothetical protein